MLSHLNPQPLSDDVSISQSVLGQPLLEIKFKDFRPIAEKRTSVVARLQLAKACELMGNDPWTLISNPAYKSCERPCVSVVITLFNYSEYIYECLNSVCKSNISELPRGIEVLVIDDCSNDKSASMVEEYLNKSNTPICLVKKCFNTGLADARNVGLKITRSPYVFILDADNGIYPNCLSVLYNAIKSSSYAAVYGMIRQFDQESKKTVGLVSCSEWNLHQLVKDPYIDAMALFNKDTLLKVGSYSTELIEYGWFGWEDYDLWLKLAQYKYSCKLVPEVLSYYRLHSLSMINTTNECALNIARYFSNKFSDLVKIYSNSDMLFGFQHSELFSVYVASLQQDGATNADLQSSRFWRLKNQWFRLKKFLSLAKNVDNKL